jgi:hypothetical protein
MLDVFYMVILQIVSQWGWSPGWSPRGSAPHHMLVITSRLGHLIYDKLERHDPEVPEHVTI